jgi:alkanesulfonate monooxygenase SsuD/methylene tetrahydromethanopterin reductase-like flavin-dependent oxidoreductase (luciferase family)
MAGCEYGRTTAEVNRLVAQRTNGKQSVSELRSEGVLVGTAADIVEQLQALAQAGAQRVMLQWLAVDDLDRLQDMAEAVLPEVSPERKENR